MTSRLISQPFVIAGAIIERMGRDTLRDPDIKKMVKDYFDGKRYPLELITHTMNE